MRTGLPAVTGFGLMLWQMPRLANHQVVCQAAECDAGIALVIRDQRTRHVLLAEVYSDIAPVLSRADALRESYADLVRHGPSEASSEHASTQAR